MADIFADDKADPSLNARNCLPDKTDTCAKHSLDNVLASLVITRNISELRDTAYGEFAINIKSVGDAIQVLKILADLQNRVLDTVLNASGAETSRYELQ